jgi:ABC-type multidrug transport system fused ATPase/permease subunit
MATFAYAFREIGRLEDEGTGLTLDTMNTTNYASGYTFANVLRYLFFDSIIWGIFTWYLNRVMKPGYGQALPVYFPLMVSYWCPSRRRKGGDLSGVEAPVDTAIPVEPVSDTLRMQAREGKSIEVHQLRKTFGEKIAVDDLSLSIYNGQITALLGHNGAGKPTMTFGGAASSTNVSQACPLAAYLPLISVSIHKTQEKQLPLIS